MDRATLFSLDPVTLQRKDTKELGKDLRPNSNFFPGIRFSLAPDGKSYVYSTDKNRTDISMLQGYRQPGLWNQIKDALRFSPTEIGDQLGLARISQTAFRRLVRVDFDCGRNANGAFGDS